MRFAVCSDESFPVHEVIIDELMRLGHEVVRFGALKSGRDESWVCTAEEATLAVVNKECDEGIFFCYSATGIAMVANKFPGIRAALCVDAETARLARVWNHANVVAMSNRLVSEVVAKEIIHAWLNTPWDEQGKAEVEKLALLEAGLRKI